MLGENTWPYVGGIANMTRTIWQRLRRGRGEV